MQSEKQIFSGALIGFILSIVGAWYHNVIFQILGNLTVAFSCYSLALSKNYKGYIGVFLGLFFNIIGFFILLILRDKKIN